MLELSRCNQISLGLLMILLFPLALVGFLILFVINIVVVLILGLFCGPCIFTAFISAYIGCFGILLCPVFMVAGAILGLLVGIFGGIIGLFINLKDYCGKIAILLSGSDEGDGGNQLMDEQL
jgi:hypothetical protein